MKKIFIFRGAPSSGKGTITEAFMKKLDGRLSYIELDTFRWGFHFKNRIVPDIADDEHKLAYENYLAVLENYLKNGTYTIVTEGLFSWDVPGPHGTMQDILKLCTQYGFKAHPILLYAEKHILWERNLKRPYTVPEEEFNALYDFVMQKRSEEETAINVGELSVEEIVELLVKL